MNLIELERKSAASPARVAEGSAVEIFNRPDQGAGRTDGTDRHEGRGDRIPQSVPSLGEVGTGRGAGQARIELS